REVPFGGTIHAGESAIAKRLGAFERHWPLRGQRLLDVGCGNGMYTIRMAEHFDETHAIDVERHRLDQFRRTLAGSKLGGKVTVREMSAETLDYPDGYFDVVTAIEVIEHIV